MAAKAPTTSFGNSAIPIINSNRSSLHHSSYYPSSLLPHSLFMTEVTSMLYITKANISSVQGFLSYFRLLHSGLHRKANKQVSTSILDAWKPSKPTRIVPEAAKPLQFPHPMQECHSVSVLYPPIQEEMRIRRNIARGPKGNISPYSHLFLAIEHNQMLSYF